MKTEIQSAVDFISNLLRSRVPENQVEQFRQQLGSRISSHYQGHWFPEKPFKGSGYRCIRINHKMDPLILSVGVQIGLAADQLFTLLPSELTMWVDPDEVSYRIGEEGSIGVIYDSTGVLTARTAPDDDEFDSPSSSSGSSQATDSDSGSLSVSPTPDFLQSCKGDLNYFESSNMNMEYLRSTFVAS
jgi:protein Tob/BTG